MDHPSLVRSRADRVYDVTEVELWIGQPDWHAIRDFRIWLYTATWPGTPEPGLSMAQLLTTTVPEAIGLRLNPEARTAVRARVHWGEAARVAPDLPAVELSDLLVTLDPATVARAQTVLGGGWGYSAGEGLAGPRRAEHRPTDDGGMAPGQIAAHFRSETGRLTPAQVLGGCIAQATVLAKREELRSAP